VITDAASAARRGRGVVATVAAMLRGLPAPAAVDVAVVVREKAAAVDDVTALCGALRAITRRAGVGLLVHGRPALVGPLGLDGVHLDGRADAAVVRAARLRLPPGAWLGVSRHAHDVGAGGLAVEGADYATLSPVFRPTSKPDDERPPLGPAALSGHRLPVFALGGVDEGSVGPCLAAGAAGVAVLGGVMGATDPARALSGLRGALPPRPREPR
jgi:thiamine-phosphate pyrophosphorylase